MVNQHPKVALPSLNFVKVKFSLTSLHPFAEDISANGLDSASHFKDESPSELLQGEDRRQML